MKLSRPSFAYLRRHRRLMVLIVSIVLLVLGIAYSLWSSQQWGQYQPAYKAQQAIIQDSLDKVYARAAVTAKDKTAVRNDLTGVSQTLTTFELKACRVNALIAWQGSVITSLQEERDLCHAQAAKMAELNTQLRRVIAFLEDDQAVTEQLGKVSQTDELADAVWQEQVTTWQSMSQTLEVRSASQDYKSIQQLAVQKTKAIAGAWEAIITTHTAKDKQKYMAAQDDLAEAYDGLDEISIETVKVITELANVLEEKYQVAF